MKIAFRADASMRIGTGHVVRCLNLARVLRARGAVVTFITRAHEGHLGAMLGKEGFGVALLPAPPMKPDLSSEDYAQWLGVPVAQDAAETMAAIGEGTDWLVMDHYGLDASWQAQVRGRSRRILAMEDLPGRTHDCDVLLDQNALGDGDGDYGRRAPGARLLLGPRHALLSAQYARRRESMPPRAPGPGRALVFFGGTDPADLTGRALEALCDPALAALPADIVLGPNYPFAARLEAAVRSRPGTRVLGPQPHLADLMAASGLAVGGGGVTAWERMCLGLPAVVVSLAENQRPASEALAAQGLIAYAGHFDTVTPRALAQCIARTMGDAQLLEAMSARGMQLVDGLGAWRAAETMMPTPAGDLSLRPARPGDAALYFGWVNDPAVRASAFDVAPVTWEGHVKWFRGRLASPASMLFVMEAQGLPVGQVRFDVEDGTAFIDYTLDPLVRGRGWATRLLSAGMAAAGADVRGFRAEVRETNGASLAAFRRLRFQEESGPDGRRVFTRAAE